MEYFTPLILSTYCTLSHSKIWKKSLEWILRYMLLKIWTIIGLKLPICPNNFFFLEITLMWFLSTYCPFSSCKVWKKILSENPEKLYKVQKFTDSHKHTCTHTRTYTDAQRKTYNNMSFHLKSKWQYIFFPCFFPFHINLQKKTYWECNIKLKYDINLLPQFIWSHEFLLLY